MSIRPIDYSTSLLNSVNESKTQHIDYHKLKENSQYLQANIQNQVKRSQKKVLCSEQSLHKKVDNKNKEQSHKKKEQDNKEACDGDKDNSERYKKVKGQNIDIFI